MERNAFGFSRSLQSPRFVPFHSVGAQHLTSSGTEANPSGAARRVARKRSAACDDTIERAQRTHGIRCSPPDLIVALKTLPLAHRRPGIRHAKFGRPSSPDARERNQGGNAPYELSRSHRRVLTVSPSSIADARARARARLFREEVPDAAECAHEREYDCASVHRGRI